MEEEVIKQEEMPMPKLRMRLKERYADIQPQTDEEWAALEDRFADETAEMESELASYKEANMTLQELVEMNPELGSFLVDLAVNKMPLSVAFARNMDMDSIMPQEGEPDMEAYKEAYKERLSQKEKRKKLDETILKNEQESLDRIDAFAVEKGLTEEQKQQLLDAIEQDISDILQKNITEKILNVYYKDMVFEEEVSAAQKAGEITGRNAVIEQQWSKPMEGDNIPDIKGGSSIEDRPKKESIFSGMKQRKTL